MWLGALLINLWVVLEHYLAAQSAFTLLGTEAWPLSRDPLIGPIVGVFVREANLPQALSLTLSVGIWLSLLLLVFEAVETAHLVRHFVDTRAAGEAEEARAAQWEIGERLLLLTLVAAALVPAIRWDMLLFEFRTAASPLGDVAQAPGMVQLKLQDGDFKSTFTYLLATAGAWGYLGITLACALALEMLGSRVGDKVELLGAALERLWNPDEETPVADDAPIEEVPANDAEPAEASLEMRQAATEASEPAVVTATPREAAQPAPPPRGAAPAAPAPRPLFPPEIAARTVTGPPLNPTTPAPRLGAQDLREVIGGRPGELIGLADAKRQSDRYHVDLATESIWPLDYWESLHGVAESAEDQGRAA
jgi:hypothetical protein